MKKNRFIVIFILALLLTFTQQSLLSQTSPVKSDAGKSSDYWSRFKFEISTAVSFQKSMADTSYFHQYSPPFLSGPYVSTGEQTIKIHGKEGWGFNVGLAYFPATHFGIQLLVDYAKPHVSGDNTDYYVWLNYGFNPEGTPPYPHIFEYTYGWPDTAGHLTEVCASLNGAFRLPISRRLALSASGGLTYFHVDTTGTGLAYSYYWWEDGWFKGRTFDVKCDIGTIDKLGLNLGAELNWVLFSNMCFVLDARYFASAKETLRMNIVDEGLITPPPPPFAEITYEEVKETMNLKDIVIDPSFYRINIGLKYLF
jgi:hypothetical protein